MSGKYPYKQILKALQDEAARVKDLENFAPPKRFHNLGTVVCSEDPNLSSGGKIVFVPATAARETLFRVLFAEAVATMDQDDYGYYTRGELDSQYPFVLGSMEEDSFYQIVSSTYDNFECSCEDSQYDEDYVTAADSDIQAVLTLTFDNEESIPYFKNWLFANHANYLEWMMESERHNEKNITAMRWLDSGNEIQMVSGRQRKE
jgi:hypothetical protein